MASFEKEYEILRHEIDQKLELENTLLTFTITSTILVLTVAASERITILYLFPFCIIIPMATRILYCIKAIVKLSAYMIVFLEPKMENFNWEVRNYTFSKKFGGLRNGKDLFKLNYFELFILSFVSYFLYLLDYISLFSGQLSTLELSGAILPAFFLLWVTIITHKMNRADKYRQEFINYWKEIKIEETETH